MVLLEKFEDRGRALDGEFALALALPKKTTPPPLRLGHLSA